MNKIITKFLLTLILVFSNSCVTKAVWGDKTYKEEIDQFFVGSDGRYIALIGPRYHYVFTDNSGVLRTILQLQKQNVLTIDDKNSLIKLDPNNNLSGYITLKGPFNLLTRNDMYALQGLGFYPDNSGDVKVRIDNLLGRRYVARYLGAARQSSASHILTISYNDSNLVKGVGKAAVTPIAVTLDAAILIGKVFMVPFKNY